MTAQSEKNENNPISTITIESTELLLGRQLASLVNALMLGPTIEVIQKKNSNTKNLTLSGTNEQIKVFKGALNVYRESIETGMSERALKSEMDTFFSLQQIRHGQ